MWTGGAVPFRNIYGRTRSRTDPNCTGTVCTGTAPHSLPVSHLKAGDQARYLQSSLSEVSVCTSGELRGSAKGGWVTPHDTCLHSSILHLVSCIRQGMLTLSGAPSTTYFIGHYHLSVFGLLHLDHISLFGKSS